MRASALLCIYVCFAERLLLLFASRIRRQECQAEKAQRRLSVARSGIIVLVDGRTALLAFIINMLSFRVYTISRRVLNRTRFRVLPIRSGP